MKKVFSSKKITAMAALLLSVVLVLSACGSNSKSSIVEGKTNVVTSFYPLYYFASEIGGEYVNVVNLIPAGVEPHDWTPKSQDLSTASKAQLFLYNGAGLEGWTDSFLKGLPNDQTIITAEMSKGIELIQGNSEEEHEHDHSAETAEEHADHEEHSDEADGAAADEHDHEHALDVDPHTWVSPKSAIIMAENVKNSLIQVDSAHKTEYEANYEALHSKLAALDAKFEQELSKTTMKDIVVSHQAFGYLARDYGLTQTAIMGLSADAEPRAQDLLNIAKFVKEQGIRYIFFEELVSPALADTLASEAKVDTLMLNPVEGLTPEQEKNGDTYITLMEANLQNLLKALQ
ncbi:ABC transporter substrate-binding protein [Paenibacillus sp. BIHB 4019]|uniref:ABC transporter substrate-binding protein n=1 Tax=Paenibacillus sp. BIHB 4019 TaxID=1870819 RepID=A0A1B2DLY7_9BACL|nr:zinc ABC transporter substrate-binding protein [Paenibacillus sp. BIHB 4019]ANY68716.1 ABC transporter substrate-binding protein [Paenibacillus sp. BIHB 4019]